MSRIYSPTNRIRFTDIPEKYAAPRQYRAKISDIHSAVVTYVYEHYKDTKKYRQKVVDVLNCLTYYILQNSTPSFKWVSTDPLNTMPDMNMDEVESVVGGLWLSPEAIEWDVPVSSNSAEDIQSIAASSIDSVSQPSTSLVKGMQPVAKLAQPAVTAKPTPAKPASLQISNRPLQQVKREQKEVAKNPLQLTRKEDLYIQSPECPRFDTSKVWISANVDGDNLAIYTTLPEIPTCQNEISITTNVDAMTESELMALYPNQLIHTRSPKMYERYKELDYDEDLGCIIPIQGFTKEQVVDNIIRYPHLFRLRKIGPDKQITKFFSSIEINGELLPIESIWDNLPEAQLMPRDAEFVKEYVIRRYLLEEENGMTHQYNIYGGLEPFLTLFMPCTDYIRKGYTDTLAIVKQCVTSRVHYKQTRSPILRRIEGHV